jgi:exoribonuclease II
VEAAALLMRLHSAPMYFYRKGRGRYRPAPPETLAAALAAVQRRRQQDELRQQYVDELLAGRAPAAIAARAIELPSSRIARASNIAHSNRRPSAKQTTPLKLLLAIGAIGSPYRWHVDGFFATHFPRGAGFASDLAAAGLAHDLPLATVHAFSIDDSATTEIDDAFSVQPAGERLQIGIHIAAPAVERCRAITRSTRWRECACRPCTRRVSR